MRGIGSHVAGGYALGFRGFSSLCASSRPHGLLIRQRRSCDDQPGLRSYIDAIEPSRSIRLNCPVQRITRDEQCDPDHAQRGRFRQGDIACHSDQALRCCKQRPTPNSRLVWRGECYADNVSSCIPITACRAQNWLAI